MDSKKDQIKNIGNKLTDEHVEGNKDMSKELANLNNIVDDKKLPVITKVNWISHMKKLN